MLKNKCNQKIPGIIKSLFFPVLLALLLQLKIYAQDVGSIFENGRLKVSENGRYLQFENGKPFFWLGDTGWLLFSKLNREDADRYLSDRAENGFNVIQVMVIHSFPELNAYGDTAFINNDPLKPNITPGNDPTNKEQYDFWDHIDYIVNKAAAKGIFIGMVPIWGSNVKNQTVNYSNAANYASWLANRYKDKPNIIWINGGDIKGSDFTDIWNEIGNAIRKNDPNHLITFHPFGRTQSSTWFHKASWLDFNMFQSGHKRYDQDPDGFGEDNWKYVQIDYSKTPVKPTLDGEPSYENIPQGLHDTTQAYWKSNDVRRYAYWSVFAGACGFTYGDNAVMQMHKPDDKVSSYGAKEFWYDAINDTGATQMKYLKELMLSFPYFDRVHDQSIIKGINGEKYDHILATKGKDYILIYTYNGRSFTINMGKISGDNVKAYWFNPRNGKSNLIGEFNNKGVKQFDPPGDKRDGNDWVLVLKSG